MLSLEGYEADDVIGTLAKQAAAKGINAVIVSGDKDFVQLIDKEIWILNPVARPSGIHPRESGTIRGTPAERLGVPPEWVIASPRAPRRHARTTFRA